ncbi:MAG TPA: ABC transporter ATP-binding protein [Candidatus Dormibacteraeota bacterium]
MRTVDLVKFYGRIEALAGLSMQVERGEVFGFLGPNGAGKTTSVKLLLGLLSPTAGEGWVLGLPIGSREARRRLGYLPELFRYQGWLTAREVLALHCELARLERSRWPAEIDRVLAVAGLTERAGDRVATYSKGMTQRLGLAVALLGTPELVILDEPTSALDPVGRHDVREIIRDLRRQGVAVFLNSHLLSEVEQVCDRVAIVNRGRVIATGPLEELLSAHAVRLRVAGLSPGDRASLAGFGEVQDEEGWLVVRGCEPERVPDLVSSLVALGVRVYAVEPQRGSLEQRFLELLSDEAAGGQ